MRFSSKSEAFFFYLCMVLVAVLIMAQPARAETIAATVIPVSTHHGYWSAANGPANPSRFYMSLQTACDASMQAYPGVTSFAAQIVAGGTYGNGRCIAGAGSTPYVGWVLDVADDDRCYPDGSIMGASCNNYSCPPNQNWTLVAPNCTRPDCGPGETRDPVDGICKAPEATCPTLDENQEPKYLGYRVMSIPVGVDPDSELTNACDPANCAVGVTVAAHIFGVALIRTVPLDRKCPDLPWPSGFVPTPSTVLTVTFKNISDPQKTDFDKVVATAAKVKAPVVESEKAVLDRLKAQLDVVKAAIAEKQASFATAVSEQTIAAKNLSDAANRYMLNPTPENLQSFEQFKAEYAAKSAASRYKLTTTQAKQKEATGLTKTIPLMESGAKEQITESGKLETDIQTSSGSSGVTFDPAKVEALKGDITGLGEKLAAAEAANQGLKDSIVGLTTEIGRLVAGMNDLGQSVQAAIDGMADAGVPDDGTIDTAPETPPDPDFCTTNPSDPSCAPPPTVPPVTGGSLPTLSGSWYTKKYPGGLGGVMSTNFTTMKATPLFAVITDIVPTISGSAHTGCFTIEIWRVGTQQLCIPQIVMQALGVFMLLTAVFAARAIIFGG